MRGAFFVVILIALLVVGVLLIKNMTTEVDDGVQRMETVQKAKETVREVDDKTRELQDNLKQATQGLEDAR